MLDIITAPVNAQGVCTVEAPKKNDVPQIERLRFSFEEGSRYEQELQQSGFTIHKIDSVVHEILGSRLGVGEFFRDNFGLIYAIEEYVKALGHLRVESNQIKELIQEKGNMPHYQYEQTARMILDEGVRKLTYMFPNLKDEINNRSKIMAKYLKDQFAIGGTKGVYEDLGEYLLPTPINDYIGSTDNTGNRIVGLGKTMQMVLSVIKGTREIVGLLITYEATFEEAYQNEFERHYPGDAKLSMQNAIIEQYGYMPDKFLVFPVIGMKPGYHSLREMLRMMRDASTHLIDDRLAAMPGLAEMDLSNNFFELCANQLDVYPLPLKNREGREITAQNTRLNYKSTPVRFNSFSAVEKTRGGVSSVIERTTTPNHHLYKNH